MITIESLQAAIEEIGPRDPDILSIIQRDTTSWAVRAEDIDVEIEFEGGRVTLQSSLGPVPEDRRGTVYGTLLQYNLLRQDTGGVTMALTADGIVVQMLDFAEAQVSADLLLRVLNNFVTKARIWRGFVLSGPDVVDTADLGIRV